MGIIDTLYKVVRKEGDKCPWCNTTDVVKGRLVIQSHVKNKHKYFRCNRYPECKFWWKQIIGPIKTKESRKKHKTIKLKNKLRGFTPTSIQKYLNINKH